MTYAKRTDRNQAAIVETLRKAGYYVCLTHRQGGGFPDLLVVSKSRIAVLLEVKVGDEMLNEREKEFHHCYPGSIGIVRSPEQAVLMMSVFDAMEIRERI